MSSPLQRFNAQNKERWTVLQDMPKWITEPVIDWLGKVYYHGSSGLRSSLVRGIQTKFRIILNDVCPFGFVYGESHFRQTIEVAFVEDDERALLLLDITIKYIRDYAERDVPYGDRHVNDEQLLEYVDRILANGSKWTVIQERNADSGIKERVDSGVIGIAESLDEDHLTRAWNLAFQLKPDAEKAVEEAQKAVEAIASKSGLTNLTTGVYGGLIGDIRAHPDKYKSIAEEAYTLHDVLNKKDNHINNSFSIWVAETLDLIQKTHPARHKSEAVRGFKLSAESAQQAVVMATLIGWIISKGFFSRKP